MKEKAKRLLALVVCLIMLCALLATPISAAASTSKNGSVSSNMTNIDDVLNMITYAKYREQYADKPTGTDKIVINAQDYVKEEETGLTTDQIKTRIEEIFADGLESSEKEEILALVKGRGSELVSNVQLILSRNTADGEKLSQLLNAITDSEPHAIDTLFGKDGGLYVPETGSVSWSFTVPQEGKYVIEIEYCQTAQEEGKKNTNSIERVFYINGEVPFSEARSIVLSKIWKYQYVSGSFEIDEATGNDIRPSVNAFREWTTFELKDSNGYYPNPFEFYFANGENTITLEGVREPVIIRSITLRPQEETISYEEYLASLSGKVNASSGSSFVVQAENPSKVSNVTMYPINDRTSPLTQGLTGNQTAQAKKLNTFGKEQWQTVGEWATYDIIAPQDGYYTIAIRYKQDLLAGMAVYRKLTIDYGNTGDFVLPFKEAASCRFGYTKEWKTVALNDGNVEFKIYLPKGQHTIKLEAVLGDMADQIQKVTETLANINSCYLEIIKLTGSTPDSNRTYNFSRVMPDVLETMILEANNLEAVYNSLLASEDSEKGEQAAIIEQIYILLRKMGTDESQIPNNLGSLKSQIGSLGTWINTAKTQPLQVDYIKIQSPNDELPQSEANFFKSLWFELQLFWYSFFNDENSMEGTTTEGGQKEVEVWVTTSGTAGRDEAQIIKSLSEDFSHSRGIAVTLKLVSGGTLLPSVLAGVGPDVSLMESSTTIIDYALRHAVIPLNQFMSSDPNAIPEVQLTDEEKAKSVMTSFPNSAMIPVTLYNYDIETDTRTETYYALPDSLQFSMMFYRKDVLSSLGINVEDIKTWDDLLSILPVLQYNNMEIGIQNDMYMFIYQSGNEAYADNGLRINFNKPEVLDAFTKLCNMYTQYSLPYTYDFANRFRTGEMPIGIAAYTTCNQLAIFASELSGLWGFTELPGEYVRDEQGNIMVDEDGERIINNSAMATVSGCIMLTGCENQKEAWEFMKWYTSEEFQVPYSHDIVAIKGIAARPATANTAALKQLPWTNEEKENILKQFENLAAVENHPGSYYLARYVDFAFLAAYNDGEAPANALLDYVAVINKEITRKRQEFGMDTLEVGQTLADIKASKK